MPDKQRAAKAIKELLIALDQDTTREGLRDTPARVAQMFMEQVAGNKKNSLWEKSFSEEKFDELVLVRDVPFVSCCEHHMVFYSGKAHVGYLPRKRLLGLSKLARLVHDSSRGFTIQERVTKIVADKLYDRIEPLGCIVVLEAEHDCMSLRGVRAIGSSTVTSAVRGVFLTNPAARQECLAFITRGGSVR